MFHSIYLMFQRSWNFLQLGFTAGIMVKLANILVTKKRSIAVEENEVVLYEFLDASRAFDKTLRPIMMKIAYQMGIEDDNWLYWYNMHKNSKKVIKWKGEKSEMFDEEKGLRQGGIGAAEEYKNYTGNMLHNIESMAGKDTLSGHPTSVVAVADDTAVSSRGINPREAISDLQVLLYATQDDGELLHTEFGAEKCQLLISAKPHKLRKTLKLLEDEPEILTFYGAPVTVIKPGEYYLHLGVPQAPVNQSKIAVDYRIKKGNDMFFSHQDVMKNSLQGISPMTNKNIVDSYLVPAFTYVLDTININPTDMDRLEIKFRNILRSIQGLSPSVNTAAIYLMIGCLPITAERDIQIMRLVGQTAISQ